MNIYSYNHRFGSNIITLIFIITVPVAIDKIYIFRQIIGATIALHTWISARRL